MIRLLTFAAHGEIRLGALDRLLVIDLNRLQPSIPSSLYGLIVAGDAGMALVRETIANFSALNEQERTAAARAGKVYGMEEIKVLAPIPQPRRNVFCVGRNYLKHAEEGALRSGTVFHPPEYPEFFTKPPTAVVGTDSIFPLDEQATQQLDYEVELAVIISRHGRDISRERAMDHVFGYTVANDLSARDQQQRHGQWFKGKAFDNSCPLGPVVVPQQDIANPHDLVLQLAVNGKPRQKANTGEMSWKIPDIIYWLSQGTSLEPGDVILTGTPQGVGASMTPPSFLQVGDVVEAEISEIGKLRTFIVEG